MVTDKGEKPWFIQFVCYFLLTKEKEFRSFAVHWLVWYFSCLSVTLTTFFLVHFCIEFMSASEKQDLKTSSKNDQSMLKSEDFSSKSLILKDSEYLMICKAPVLVLAAFITDIFFFFFPFNLNESYVCLMHKFICIASFDFPSILDSA